MSSPSADAAPSATGTELLRIQAQRVADARREVQAVADLVGEERQRWEAAHEPLLTRAQNAKLRVAEEELRLRDLAVAEHRATGAVKPGPGVAIRQETVIEYDPLVAFEWGLTSRMAVKLDTSAFEKIAKATPLPFVTTRKEPKATIATDLDKALAEGGA